MGQAAYTPAEFAALFGKERTWAYRQLYAGKIEAITEYGRLLIPQKEVDKLLSQAGRYAGRKSKPRRKVSKKTRAVRKALDGKNWVEAIKQRRKPSLQRPASARSADGRKSL